MTTRRKPWLEVAADAAQCLEGLSGPHRRKALADGVKTDRWPAQNLRRMLSARAYVISNAKNCGVEVGDVRGSYEAIENLTRVAKISPAVAGEHMRRVFTGAMNAREIRAVLTDMRKKAAERPAAGPNDDDGWSVYWEETVNVLLGDTARKVSVAHKGHSTRGRWLGVDIEVTVPSDKIVAIFLSPRCKFSTWARKPVEDQLPSVLCAMAFYSRVYFIFYEERESALIKEMIAKGDWGGKDVIVQEPIPWNEESNQI